MVFPFCVRVVPQAPIPRLSLQCSFDFVARTTLVSCDGGVHCQRNDKSLIHTPRKRFCFDLLFFAVLAFSLHVFVLLLFLHLLLDFLVVLGRGFLRGFGLGGPRGARASPSLSRADRLLLTLVGLGRLRDVLEPSTKRQTLKNISVSCPQSRRLHPCNLITQ